jgi:hypothetical protein
MENMNRRMFGKKALLATGALLVLPELTGCPVTQSQIAALVAEVGTGLSGILPYIKGVSATLATQIEASFAALQAAVQAWKPGTSIQDIEQVVNAFVANMALIPVLGAYQPLVALIVATAEGIITLLVPNATAAPRTTATSRFVVTATSQYPHPPNTARSFRGTWNGVVKKDSALAGLEIS